MYLIRKNNLVIVLYTLFLILPLLFISCSDGKNKEDSYMITVDKVYGDGAKYCAFTSLIKRGNVYYLAFREGESHVSEGDYGQIIILYSRDAKKWNHFQTIKADNIDLRDPQLTITPDGHLLLLCGARMKKQPEEYFYTKSYYAIENSGVFSEVQPCNIPPEVDDSYCCWLWKLTWKGNCGYGAAYRSDGITNKLTLLSTVDGINYDVVADINKGQVINETRIQFLPNNEMIALIRSEAEGYIGHSLPPYTEWDLKKTNIFLAGHDFVISDNHLICATRLTTNIGGRTTLWFGDLEGNFQWSYVLPSSGDTAYSGIVEEKDRLLMSYYSMYQTYKPSICIAIIPKVSLPYLK